MKQKTKLTLGVALLFIDHSMSVVGGRVYKCFKKGYRKYFSCQLSHAEYSKKC